MKPNKLKQNDKIVILSPSGKVGEERVREASKVFENWGLEVTFGENAFNKFNKFAGTDEERASDLQKALDNPKIKAIMCSRGGYGLVRIIDKLDFTEFVKNPKWIVGFSDVTVLHNHIHTNFGVSTIHATSPNSFETTPKIALESIRKALFFDNYQLETEFNNQEIVGGNLAIVYSLLGTNSDINTDGKVLLLEEIGEHAYNVDRMLFGLKKAGKFNKLKGLIIGCFTGTKEEEEFGFTVKEIIENCTQEFDFPVQFDLPVGHVDDNRAVILGK